MLTFYDKSNKGALLEKLSDRADNTPPEILSTVASVIADIRRGGDSALRDYTSRFDHVDVDDFFLSDDEAEKAVSKVDPALIKTMEKAAENIRAFHEKQLAQSVSYCRPGVMMGQRVIPLSRVGLYVPGGTAAFFELIISVAREAPDVPAELFFNEAGNLNAGLGLERRFATAEGKTGLAFK